MQYVFNSPIFHSLTPNQQQCWSTKAIDIYSLAALQIISAYVLDPENESQMANNVVVVVLLLVSPKALSLQHRSSLNFTYTYSVSQKNPPPWNFLTFFPNGWEFLVQILHAYYTFLSTLDYKFLFNYPQLWRSYSMLSATTIMYS